MPKEKALHILSKPNFITISFSKVIFCIEEAKGRNIKKVKLRCLSQTFLRTNMLDFLTS